MEKPSDVTAQSGSLSEHQSTTVVEQNIAQDWKTFSNHVPICDFWFLTLTPVDQNTMEDQSIVIISSKTEITRYLEDMIVYVKCWQGQQAGGVLKAVK